MLPNSSLSTEIDQELLKLAVALQILPEGGKMDQLELDKKAKDQQHAIVTMIESCLKMETHLRTRGRIIYNEQAMKDVGLTSVDEEQEADDIMKLYCKELKTGI